MSARMVGGYGGRRLTLAPAASSTSWPQPVMTREPLVGLRDELQREKKVEEEEEVCLPIMPSQVNLACDFELCPKDSFSAPTKHFASETRGETRPRAIGSRFWVLDGGDSEEEEEQVCHREEEVVGSVQKGSIVRKAMAEGFTLDEILSAGEYLLCTNSSPKAHSFPGSTRTKGKNHLVDRLVAAVCRKKVSMCKPWKGPLPSRRISQPRKLETFLSAALEDWQRKRTAGLEKTLAKFSKREDVNASTFSGNLDKASSLQFSGRQLAQEDEASVCSSLLHGGTNMDGPTLQIGKGDRGVNVKFCSVLGRLLSHAGRHSLARKERNKGEIERPRQQSQLGLNICNRERRQRGSEEGGLCVGGKLQVRAEEEKEVRKGGMARRKDDYDGCSNKDWGQRGSFREEEEGFGTGFQGSRMGFDPGYGFGQQGSFGQRWQRHGYRPRGARGFGPRRSGFAGRPGRGSARGFGSQRPAFERKMDDMGRKGEEKGGAASSERNGGAGRVKVGEVEVLVLARKEKQPMVEKKEENGDFVEMECDPSLFEDQQLGVEKGKV